jgi:hypothetical protein
METPRKPDNRKTVKIDQSVHDRLVAIQRKGETLSDTFCRVLKIVEGLYAVAPLLERPKRTREELVRVMNEAFAELKEFEAEIPKEVPAQ